MSDGVSPLPDRRETLRRGVALAALLAGGLLGGRQARAADDESAFGAESMQDALRALGGVPAPGRDIELTVPDLAENGAYVPVMVDCRLPGTREIFVIVDSNPNPLVARFSFGDGADAFVSTRIKMAASGKVYAVARAGDRLYAVSRDTKVVVGGCG